MKWLAAIIVVTVAEWIVHPLFTQWSWQIALGAKYLTVVLLIQALWSVSKNESLLFRSLVALFCVNFFIDLVDYMVWVFSKTHINLSLPIFLIFSVSMIYILWRRYDIKSDKVDHKNVIILLMKPRTLFEFVKAFVGVPVASVCIVADGYVWSFRKCTGSFDKIRYSNILLTTHVAIDTKVACNKEIIEELEKIVGTNRIPNCKCVFSIRKVLNLIGGKFSVGRFDYIPGIYALRILQ